MAGHSETGRASGGLEQGAVIDALPRAIVVTDPDGVILIWNKTAEELYGWKADEVVGRPVSDVLVPLPDRERGQRIVEQVRAGSTWEGDFTVLRRDGEPVRVWVTDRPVLGESGEVIAILGASEDVTEKRVLEQRASDLTEHLQLALDAGRLGTFRWDLATGVTDWDERLERLFGLEPGGFDGTFDAWVAMLHPDDAAQVLATIDRAVQTKGRYTVQHRVVWPDGSVRWLQGAGQVTLDAAGNVTGTIGCTRDVTERVLDELERQRLTSEAVALAEEERVNRERLEFLTSINDALSAAHSRSEVMHNVTRAAVPGLADWCSIFVLPSPGAHIPEVETAHVDPAMVAYAHELQERFPYDPDAPTGMPNVIRNGATEFYPVIDNALIESIDAPDEARQVVRELSLHSAIAVPLVKRGQIIGGIQLVMTSSRRQYTEDDVTLAHAVAARIASSLDNLRLADEQRRIASTLQTSLLPSRLPDIPGVELAVRYWANGEGIEVGGDFYDVFSVDKDTWSVVIGDVCGTGPSAAAVTGLARHTIAAAAWHGDDHVSVLHTLNRTMIARDIESFCTALYGTLQTAPDGAVRLTFASGGHPLPVIASADGSVRTAGVAGSLVGMFDEIEVTTTTEVLRPGDMVVLYTDGATDTRPPYDLSPADFATLVGRCAANAGSADELAERVHAQLSAILPIENRGDDIALLALRITG